MAVIQKSIFKETKLDFAGGFFGGDFRLLKKSGFFNWNYWRRVYY